MQAAPGARLCVAALKKTSMGRRPTGPHPGRPRQLQVEPAVEPETLERGAERIDKISVFGGLDQVLNGLVKLR